MHITNHLSLFSVVSRRFEQLREDFQYNITLIEARDKEIQRLDSICKEKTILCERLHAENVTLSTNMDALVSTQHEKDSKKEEDKIANKVLWFYCAPQLLVLQ